MYGETSAIALLLGAMILWYKRIIGFAIPLFYIGQSVLFWLFNGTGDLFTSGVLLSTYQILAGGLLLGAFFITDMVGITHNTQMERLYLVSAVVF